RRNRVGRRDRRKRRNRSRTTHPAPSKATRPWTWRPPRRRALTDGQDIAACKADADAEVQNPCIYSMYPLRASACCVSQVRGVPHLPARARARGPDSRNDEVLVVATG